MLGLAPLGSWNCAEACDLIVVHAAESGGPGAVDQIEKHLRKPYWLDEASFGMDADAEAGLEAMERMWAAQSGPPPRTHPRPERPARAPLPAPD